MTPKECEKIYEEAYRAVYWTALALLKNEADAEDVVQDTFVTLIERYDTLQDKSKVVPWLKKICANKCLNLLTRTKTQAMEQEYFDNLEAVPEDFLPESIVESQEKRRIVMDIIERALSEEARRTIILYYFDEMSTKEIAEAMGVPQGTVLWRLSYARAKIKKEVEKYEKDNDYKLYAVAVPFLTLLFIRESEQVPVPPMPDFMETLSASTHASNSEAVKTIVSETLRKGTGIAMKNIILGFIGFLMVGAVVAGIIVWTNRDDDSGKGKKDKDNTVIQNDDNTDPGNKPGSNDPGNNDPGSNDPGNYGSDDPTPLPTIDVDNYDWGSVFKWEGSKIVGINNPVDEALRNTGILVIPSRCESIGANAFGEKPWIKEVRFETPEKVTMIEDFAMCELNQLHSFAFPSNSNLFQEDQYWQEGAAPFAPGASIVSTKLHNLVLPNGKVFYEFMRRLGVCEIGSPQNNQVYLENVFVPENFSIYYNDPERDNHCFAKYSPAFYEANWSQYKQVLTVECFSNKPCKIYVVAGSWADANFDDWTAGDLVQKEYWDGVNYTFPEYDPLWDIQNIRIEIGNADTTFEGLEDEWEVRSYNENNEKIFEGNITQKAFESLYHEIVALAEEGKIEKAEYGEKNKIKIKCFNDKLNSTYICSDASVLQALIDKYTKTTSDLATDKITVSFDVNGGVAEEFAPITVEFGEKYGALPTDPARNDHVFLGWYTEREGGEEITNDSVVTVKDDLVLYAHWWKNVYIVTYQYITDDASGGVQTVTDTYSIDFTNFFESSHTEQRDLITTSLKTAMAAFDASAADPSKSRASNIRNLMDNLGFDSASFCDMYDKPTYDSIGFAIGKREIIDPMTDEKATLILVAIRGAGYGDEWGGNFRVVDLLGSNLHHYGFDKAATQVINTLEYYINTNLSSIEGNVKIWVVGYSRAAATTNLVCSKIIDGWPLPITVRDTDVFGFGFETPRCTTDTDSHDSRYDGIKNVINPIDFVPMVAMNNGSKWNYDRYGIVYTLPTKESNPKAYDNMKAEYGRRLETYGRKSELDIRVGEIPDQHDFLVNVFRKLADKTITPRAYCDSGIQDALIVVMAAYMNKEIHGDILTEIPNIILNLERYDHLPAEVKLVQTTYIGEVFRDTGILELVQKMGTIQFSHYPELCLSWLSVYNPIVN